MGLLARIRKEWFIIGIVAVIVSAKLQPSFGLKGAVRLTPAGELTVPMAITHISYHYIFCMDVNRHLLYGC
uniref:Uncharacterized protein n=1 Tax=Salmo trutta TaxID=8032 RepID=A0A673W001_SALTR